MLVENLLNDKIALQQYIKNTKGWNSWSKQFVNFSLAQLNIQPNDYIPETGSDDANKIIFIGNFYGVIPTSYYRTTFRIYLNGSDTQIDLTQKETTGTGVSFVLPQPFEIPCIFDSISFQQTDNLAYNFQGYIFYSN